MAFPAFAGAPNTFVIGTVINPVPMNANFVSIATYLNNDLGPYIDAQLALKAPSNLTGGTGIAVQTGAATYTARTIVVGSGKLTVSNGDGIAGNPSLDLGSITGGTGMVSQTGAGTYTARTITAGTGISVVNGDGVAGNPTISLAGGSSSFFVAHITLTAAQVKALKATPITVVPAQGVGTYIFPVSALLRLNFNSIAFAAGAGGSNIGFATDSAAVLTYWSINGNNNQTNWNFVTNFMVQVTNQVVSGAFASSGTSQMDANTDFRIMNNATNEWINGDSTIDVWVAYYVIS